MYLPKIGLRSAVTNESIYYGNTQVTRKYTKKRKIWMSGNIFPPSDATVCLWIRCLLLTTSLYSRHAWVLQKMHLVWILHFWDCVILQALHLLNTWNETLLYTKGVKMHKQHSHIIQNRWIPERKIYIQYFSQFQEKMNKNNIA